MTVAICSVAMLVHDIIAHLLPCILCSRKKNSKIKIVTIVEKYKYKIL